MAKWLLSVWKITRLVVRRLRSVLGNVERQRLAVDGDVRVLVARCVVRRAAQRSRLTTS